MKPLRKATARADRRTLDDTLLSELLLYLGLGTGFVLERLVQVYLCTLLVIAIVLAPAQTLFAVSLVRASHVVTSYGGAHIDTSQSVFGGSSGRFGAANSYLSIPDSDDWHFGTADFTIDFWVRFNRLPSSRHFMMLYSQGPNDTNRIIVGLYNSAGIGLEWRFLSISGGSPIFVIATDDFSLTTNAWYHVACVSARWPCSACSGHIFYLFRDGGQVGTDSTDYSALADLSGDVVIGVYGTYFSSHYLDGWLDEFRISKGIARWTDNFTPPTSAYVADQYTVLLLHMDGRNGSTGFLDSSFTTVTESTSQSSSMSVPSTATQTSSSIVSIGALATTMPLCATILWVLVVAAAAIVSVLGVKKRFAKSTEE